MSQLEPYLFENSLVSRFHTWTKKPKQTGYRMIDLPQGEVHGPWYIITRILHKTGAAPYFSLSFTVDSIKTSIDVKLAIEFDGDGLYSEQELPDQVYCFCHIEMGEVSNGVDNRLNLNLKNPINPILVSGSLTGIINNLNNRHGSPLPPHKISPNLSFLLWCFSQQGIKSWIGSIPDLVIAWISVRLYEMRMRWLVWIHFCWFWYVYNFYL